MKEVLSLSEAQVETVSLLHERAIIVDSMVHSVSPNFFQSFQGADLRDYFQRAKNAGVTALNHMFALAAPSEHRSERDAHLKSFCNWYSIFEKHRDAAVLATTATDVETAKTQGKIAIFLSLMSEMNTIGEDLFLLDIYKKLGISSAKLVFNKKNSLGDGCIERTDCGLSELGVRTVEEMNRLGLVIDLSHSGAATSIDAMKISKHPVLFTHSGVRTKCDNPNNLNDEQIHALAENEGVLSLSAFSSFVAWPSYNGFRPTLEDLVDRVDYVKNLVGVDHVGVTSDSSEGVTRESFGPSKQRYPHLYPYDVENLHVNAFDNISHWPNVTKSLLARGYSDQEVLKILGGNLVRVFRTVFGN